VLALVWLTLSGTDVAWSGALIVAVLQEEMAMAAASRRMSVAPVNRAASNIRNMSGRHGSMFYGRTTFAEGSHLCNATTLTDKPCIRLTILEKFYAV